MRVVPQGALARNPISANSSNPSEPAGKGGDIASTLLISRNCPDRFLSTVQEAPEELWSGIARSLWLPSELFPAASNFAALA